MAECLFNGRKTAIVSAIAVFCAMACASSAYAAEYFVSPSGDDAADGSKSSPWRTIQRAADVATAGDTVTIREGVYREWVKPVNSGRADAPITYRAAKGEKVVVTGADPVRGWIRRPDGLWTARVVYDSFGGVNPFTDMISGDWFNSTVPCFRTRLIQDGRPLTLHPREWITQPGRASRRALVNIAGITSGPRTVSGVSAASKSPNVKPGFDTEWGKELGWIYDNSTLVYRGFDFSTSASRQLKMHLSSCSHRSIIEVCDAAAPEKMLAKVNPPITGSWREYATVEVSLPDSAANMKDLLLRVRDVEEVNRATGIAGRIKKGHAVMISGIVYGTIVAAFEKDPNVFAPELIVRPACFYPIVEHRDYITLNGIVFCNAAPNWAPPTSEQTAVVGTNWSRGWVIEDCEVHGTECSGITLGKYGDEYDNMAATMKAYHDTIMRSVSNGLDRVGHHVVRRCRIADCGQAGICGSLGAVFSRIEDCDISYCHWEKPYGGHEMGGIKIHGAVDFTIARCRIHHCGSSAAIWLDWMAQGAHIVDCRFWANFRDLFLEVNHGPILLEGNDFLSEIALLGCSQGVAFVGNRMLGNFVYHNDKRCTPVFKPHSVTLDSLDKVRCGNGAYVFVNNIIAKYPISRRSKFPSRFEDNWMIPPEHWKVDDATGECTIAPPDGSKRPDFKPVDSKSFGKPPFVDQEYPELYRKTHQLSL